MKLDTFPNYNILLLGRRDKCYKSVKGNSLKTANMWRNAKELSKLKKTT